MKKYKHVPTKITDLNRVDYIADARTAPKLSRREQEAIEMRQRGCSLEFIQRKTGLHPSQLWPVLGLTRDTPEGERDYQAAIGLFHSMRQIFNVEL